MLLVCATPIGNLDDVTLRVLETLRSADLIAAEDTRRTRKLLSHFDIHVPLTSFHAHNEDRKAGEVLAALRSGATVALVTDAGMPLISDPGAGLVEAALAEELPVTVLPGASAPTAALVASGLAGDGSYSFVGYLPRRRTDLEAAARRWRVAGDLVVAFESPRRLPKSLAALAEVAPDVAAAVCRELTKLHEQVARGTLDELAARYPVDGPAVRGEITLVADFGISGPDDARAGRRGQAETGAADEAALRELAGRLLERGLSRRDATTALAVCLGVRKRDAEPIVRTVAQERSTGEG